MYDSLLIRGAFLLLVVASHDSKSHHSPEKAFSPDSSYFISDLITCSCKRIHLEAENIHFNGTSKDKERGNQKRRKTSFIPPSHSKGTDKHRFIFNLVFC